MGAYTSGTPRTFVASLAHERLDAIPLAATDNYVLARPLRTCVSCAVLLYHLCSPESSQPTSPDCKSSLEMSASELVKSRSARAVGSSGGAGSSSGAVQYRPIAPVTPIPVVEPPPKAKRGRKPHPGSKSAREALRKESHSRIEKRRREKINDALTTLRELIAQGEGGSQRQEQSPPPGPEREFKLELLERTVSFVRGLLERTQELERELNELKGDEVEPTRKRKRMATPESSPSAGPSRQRASAEVDELELDGSSALSEPESTSDRAPSPAEVEIEMTSPMIFPSAAPRRTSMSIAALLSPATHPALPSPPPSGQLRTRGPILEGTEPQMESLSLPSPEVMLRRGPSSERSLNRTRMEEGERRMDEDTVAAALLLQFSSKTPSSMLGMH